MGNFYPRPPRGGRLYRPLIRAPASIFLSTSSARRTTIFSSLTLSDCSISIHVLREEDDGNGNRAHRAPCGFLSTSSARRTTQLCGGLESPNPISIHVLREEDDSQIFPAPAQQADFYPRPPRGGRRPTQSVHFLPCYFYPRPPRGGRLSIGRIGPLAKIISIHVLREEDDQGAPTDAACGDNFYPRPPRGGRLEPDALTWAVKDFYPRPPRGGRQMVSGGAGVWNDFYPRPPRGGRLVTAVARHITANISIHVLREEDDQRP